MKKILLAAAILTSAIATQAQAGNPWPFVGGVATGIILEDAIAGQRHYHRYERYDYPMDASGPVYICHKEPVYDQFGRRVGYREVCRYY